MSDAQRFSQYSKEDLRLIVQIATDNYDHSQFSIAWIYYNHKIDYDYAAWLIEKGLELGIFIKMESGPLSVKVNPQYHRQREIMLRHLTTALKPAMAYDGQGNKIPHVVCVNLTTEEVTRYQFDDNKELMVENDKPLTITERVPGLRVIL